MPDLERGRVSCFLSAHTAAAQRAAVAQNSQAVESGIVGYQQIPVEGPESGTATKYSFRQITFKDVGANNTAQYVDIVNVIPCQSNGAAFDTAPGTGKVICNGGIYIQRITTGGKYDDKLTYYSTTAGTGAGWYRNGSKTAANKVAAESFYIQKGEGLLVGCKVLSGAKFSTSGEVEVSDMTIDIAGPASGTTGLYTFSGNNTPVEIDLTEMIPVKPNGEPFDGAPGTGKLVCNGGIYIQKITPDGKYDDKYTYYSTTAGTGAGWYKNGSKTAANKIAFNDIKLGAGVGVLAYCKVIGGAKFSLPNPTTVK